MLITLGVYSLQPHLKEAPAQVFTYEFWKIFVNTFFTEHFPATAPDTRAKLRLHQSCTNSIMETVI